MKRILTYSTLIICAISCDPKEGSTRITYSITSELSNEKVDVIAYEDGNSFAYFSDSSSTVPTEDAWADGLFDTWPTGDVNISIPRDSVLVIFNDSLKLVHLTLRTNSAQDSIGIRENVILFDDPRNIYNINSYATERVTESRWKAKYTVMQEDFEYAIEVN